MISTLSAAPTPATPMAETPAETWRRFTEGVDAWEKELLASKAARDLLAGQRDAEAGARDASERERELCERAELFLRSEVKERRRKASNTISGLGTAALRRVYGDGYELRFTEAGVADKAANKAANLKMEIEIVSLIDGEELKTGLMGERGGGVVEVVAFALRMAALGWRHYEGPIILDEAYKSMSADEKITRVAEFLAHVTEQTGRQVVFATHKADVFGRVAHNVLRVSHEAGVASAERLSEDERAELASQETDDPALLAP